MADYFIQENLFTRQIFDLDEILACQTENDVQIIRGEDFQYMCYINKLVYATALTPMFALAYGIKVFNKRKQQDINTQKTSLYHDKQLSCLDSLMSRLNSDRFIENVCLSYRHDFGLMAQDEQQRLRFECKEWARAISNNWQYFNNAL